MRRRIHAWCLREAGDARLPVPRSRVVRLFSGRTIGGGALAQMYVGKNGGDFWILPTGIRLPASALAARSLRPGSTCFADSLYSTRGGGQRFKLGAMALTGAPQASILAAFGMLWASPLRSVMCSIAFIRNQGARNSTPRRCHAACAERDCAARCRVAADARDRIFTRGADDASGARADGAAE